MAGEEGNRKPDESQKGVANGESKAELRAWLSESDTGTFSLVQDHETNLSKASWLAEVDDVGGHWLFERPQWASFGKEDGRAVLWLQGPPGSGKSVLTARIIAELQSQDAEHTANVLYHYCHHDPRPTTSLDILKSLLIQCLDSMPDEVVGDLKTLRSKRLHLKPGDMVAEKVLWKALQATITENPQKTYLLIDGLDESQPNASPLGRLLSLLKSAGDDSRTSLLLSSRYDCDIVEALQELDSLEFLQVDLDEEAIRHDMLQYITFRVNSKSSPLRRKPQSVRDDIIQQVFGQAQSSFLYASLVLDELKGERVFSPAAIATTLQTIPSQLRSVYEKLLEIPNISVMGKEVYQWVACATRPLSWDEMRSVLAIVDGKVLQDHFTDLSSDVVLQESCGPLIEVFGDHREKLRFVHPTVKDLLLEKDGPGKELGILGAHTSISMKLLYFLQNEDLPTFFPQLSFEDNRELISEFIQRPGLGIYPYASLNWFFHVAACGADLQEEVEEQLCSFLSSPNCVSWLKGALFMSKWTDQAIDSTALTADVVRCLETWIQNRTSIDDELGATMFVRSWINDFLGLMQDWGRALEFSPFWIHFIPKQFIDFESHFRQALALRTEQAVIQFRGRPFLTASKNPTLWQQDCISIDSRRSLAYTWEQSLAQLSCYHTRTGLLAAQIKLDAGTKNLASFELVMGTQCPQNRFLALLFRDKSEANQNNPIYDQLRRGLQPTSRVHNDGRLAWIIQNESCLDELFAIPYALGVGNISSLVCLLELSHDGSMRTNLFGHPKWALDSLLAMNEQLVRWELDDPNLLAFSSDSSLLVTPASVISMETGKTVGTLSLGLDPAIGGCAIARDIKTFALVRSGNVLEFVQVPGSSGSATIKSHKFPGIVHILGISSGGRFTLLLRVTQHLTKAASAPNARDKFLQDCCIGVFDSNKKQWTPLVEIHPPLSRARSSWDFGEYHKYCRFKPESRKIFETNKVVFQCPKGWSLSPNVRRVSGLSIAAMLEGKCMIVIESEKLKDGFGSNPSLIHVGKTSEMSSSIPKVLYADFLLGDWLPTDDRGKQALTGIDHSEIESSQVALSTPYHSSSADQLQGRNLTCVPLVDRIVVSCDTISQIYQVKIQAIESPDHQQPRSTSEHQPDSVLQQLKYQVAVSYGDLGESGQFDIQVSNTMICQSESLPLESQDIFIYDGMMAIGTSIISIHALTPRHEITQSTENHNEVIALIKTFENSCQPFPTTNKLATSSADNIPRYTIFSDEQISSQNLSTDLDKLLLTDAAERRDVVLSSVSTALDHGKHIVQFARPIEKGMLQPFQREASECEIFLYIFDSQTMRVTWSVHTTSAGKIKQSDHLPKATWALHPRQPLFFWTLPGQALHVSHIDSSFPPINLGDSLMIDADDSDNVNFSPSGRYVAFLATSAFVQILLTDLTEELKTQVMVILDLVIGTNTMFKVQRRPKLSFDIDDTYLNVYQLTDLGGIRMDRYSLPDLHHSDGQILAFIPDYCCCATCNKPLKDTCHISVRQSLGLRRIVLCHSPISARSTTVTGTACEPMILNIASPEVPISTAGVRDSVVMKRTTKTFPPIIASSGDLLPEAFTSHEDATLKSDILARADFMSADSSTLNSAEQSKSESSEPAIPRKIPQMKVRTFNSTHTHDKRLDLGAVEEHWRTDYLKSISDLSIEDSIVKLMNQEENFVKWSGEYADLFPATWDEYREVLALAADDREVQNWVQILCQDSGIGCAVPMYTHTFLYNDALQDGEPDFTWTSAVDIGWIEEHAEWWTHRVLRDDFTNARMWYPFESYRDIAQIKANEQKQEKAKRSGNFDSKQLLGLDLSEKDLDKESEAAIRSMLAMRKFIDDLEDKYAGAGKIFRARFHQFLNQTLTTPEPAATQEKDAATEKK